MLNKKIKWKCRRGVLELDRVLMDFYDKNINVLTHEQVDKFNKLLDLEDPVLLEWLVYKQPALPDYLEIVALINKS